MSVDTDAIDYEEHLMAGVTAPETITKDDLPEYLERLSLIFQQISLDLFSTENRALLQCMEQFRDKSDGQGVLDEQSLLDMLIYNKATPEIQVKYTELLVKYQNKKISTAKFRYALNRFLEVKEEQSFITALNQTFLIQTVGLEQGYGRLKKQIKGYRDAKQFLLERLNDIESGSNSNTAPDGSVRVESMGFVDEAKARRETPLNFQGVLSGIKNIDDITNGAQRGELVIVGAYTEAGKTFFAISWAHNAVTVQGINTVYLTAETPRPQLNKRIYLRHCRNALFGLPQGVDASSFKLGQLTPQEIVGIEKAMEDFQNNPAYGLFDVVQVPQGANIIYIENKLNAINAQWKSRGGVQFAVLDSLNLIVPANDDPRQLRIALNSMIKRTKQFALNFDKGRGLPFLSPWHANRDSWKKAVEAGKYTLASWAEADELERSADILLWLLKLPNSVDTHEILCGMEKYRDGKAQLIFNLYEDFASSYLGTVASSSTSSSNSNVPGTQTPSFTASPASGSVVDANGLF